MERLNHTFSHEWHVAINKHVQTGADFKGDRFMYEAKKMADEVPRLALLFKHAREGSLPKTHQQCSHQAPVPVMDNHLSCCLGVKAATCPHLLALEQIKDCMPEDIDVAKAWTCAAHIIASGGDTIGEGYMLRVDDRMYWDNVYANMAMDCPE